jgi:hypothetical protein
MNSLTSEKLPILEKKPTISIHIQMNLKNLRTDPNDQLLVAFNNHLHDLGIQHYEVGQNDYKQTQQHERRLVTFTN